MILVLARYRYRIEPTAGQRSMLARTFGCARVVFNDALRCRQDAHQAGEKITPTEVQRRVITQAKTTEGRAWLGEVARWRWCSRCRTRTAPTATSSTRSQGTPQGRKVGQPRFKSRKDTRQSFRLTRNGFTLRPDGRLFLAKIGDVRVRWSRDLPSRTQLGHDHPGTGRALLRLVRRRGAARHRYR